MAALEAATYAAGRMTIRQQQKQLQWEATLIVLPPLYLAGAALFLFSGTLPNPYTGVVASLLLCLLVIAAWALRRWHELAPGWTLVIGCLIVTLLIVNWGQVEAAIFLLTVPAGLAALSLSIAPGMAFALGCSVLVLLAPAALLPPAGDLRLMTLIGIWNAFGLIWLSRRPLLTALEWSWASQEQSRVLLEQARDRQVQLKRTLADLADANLQLTRLNRLVQGLRQTAEEARRAKEQFVANVSHELRTPLNMIIGFSEMIVRAPQVYGRRIPAALLADLNVILRNSQHLSSLIDDVLDMSQIELGKMALTRERVALAEVIEAAATAVRPLFASKGLYLEVEMAEDLPPLLCDRTRLREVVLNLLSNAGRFTERGGVHLYARKEGKEIVLSVADTGPGIAEEQMDRLFQPFQQLDGSLRRRYGGTGLGLSISKSIVELHGGHMWVESQAGAGATFFLRLPLDEPVSVTDDMARWFNPDWHYEERGRPSLAPLPLLRPRFVALETGACLQRLLARYQDGTEVVPAADMDAAIQELARVPAQALLINHPSVSVALQSLSQSALPNGTPVIVCSVPGSYEAAGALGASDYLIKPISREALLAALHRLGVEGGTVLVVEDEPEAARLFQRMLTSAEPPYRVLRAGSGLQALRILRQQRVDAVLLDLIMPEMDGFRVLETRGQDAELGRIPVIIVSARDPAGQPIVANAVAVTQSGGLSVPQLLRCIQAISAILSPCAPIADRGPRETPVA